jgi:hypothetical protein
VSEQELRQWWAAKTSRDIEAMLPKMREYSSSDLQVIGAGLVPDLSPALQAEAAIAFYLLGKAARITGSLMEEREPDVDSWDDAAVYAMMGRRVREAGGWPGTATEGISEPREAPAPAPGPPQPPAAHGGPPVVYLAHPLDNGSISEHVRVAKDVLRTLGCTIYDPGLAWEIGGPGDNSTVHNANLAVLERCDLMVMAADKGTFSAGTLIEATDRGRYAPGTVVVFGPNLSPSISMLAEGWTQVQTRQELATAVNRIITKEYQ